MIFIYNSYCFMHMLKRTISISLDSFKRNKIHSFACGFNQELHFLKSLCAEKDITSVRFVGRIDRFIRECIKVNRNLSRYFLQRLFQILRTKLPDLHQKDVCVLLKSIASLYKTYPYYIQSFLKDILRSESHLKDGVLYAKVTSCGRIRDLSRILYAYATARVYNSKLLQISSVHIKTLLKETENIDNIVNNQEYYQQNVYNFNNFSSEDIKLCYLNNSSVNEKFSNPFLRSFTTSSFHGTKLMTAHDFAIICYSYGKFQDQYADLFNVMCEYMMNNLSILFSLNIQDICHVIFSFSQIKYLNLLFTDILISILNFFLSKDINSILFSLDKSKMNISLQSHHIVALANGLSSLIILYRSLEFSEDISNNCNYFSRTTSNFITIAPPKLFEEYIGFDKLSETSNSVNSSLSSNIPITSSHINTLDSVHKYYSQANRSIEINAKLLTYKLVETLNELSVITSHNIQRKCCTSRELATFAYAFARISIFPIDFFSMLQKCLENSEGLAQTFTDDDIFMLVTAFSKINIPTMRINILLLLLPHVKRLLKKLSESNNNFSAVKQSNHENFNILANIICVYVDEDMAFKENLIGDFINLVHVKYTTCHPNDIALIIYVLSKAFTLNSRNEPFVSISITEEKVKIDERDGKFILPHENNRFEDRIDANHNSLYDFLKNILHKLLNHVEFQVDCLTKNGMFLIFSALSRLCLQERYLIHVLINKTRKLAYIAASDSLDDSQKISSTDKALLCCILNTITRLDMQCLCKTAEDLLCSRLLGSPRFLMTKQICNLLLSAAYLYPIFFLYNSDCPIINDTTSTNTGSSLLWISFLREVRLRMTINKNSSEDMDKLANRQIIQALLCVWLFVKVDLLFVTRNILSTSENVNTFSNQISSNIFQKKYISMQDLDVRACYMCFSALERNNAFKFEELQEMKATLKCIQP